MSIRNVSLQKCFELCNMAAANCGEALQWCLSRGGDQAEAKLVQSLIDCITVCQSTCNFLARSSDSHMAMCVACADLCERCAILCERVANNHESLRDCAKACRQAAESCRGMSNTTVKKNNQASITA